MQRRLRVVDSGDAVEDRIVDVAADGDTKLRVFVDATIVEVFVNEGATVTVRNDHPTVTRIRFDATAETQIDEVVLYTLRSSITAARAQ